MKEREISGKTNQNLLDPDRHSHGRPFHSKSRSMSVVANGAITSLLVILDYCFSYTSLLLILWPFSSVPLVVTVRLLPSPDTTIRPLVMTLPPFMMLNPNMRSSILVYDRASDSGSPVTGYSLPSN